MGISGFENADYNPKAASSGRSEQDGDYRLSVQYTPPVVPPVEPTRDSTPPVVVNTGLVKLTIRPKPKAKARKSMGVSITFNEALGESAALNLASYALSSGRKVKKRGIVFNKRLALATATYDKNTRTVTIGIRGKSVPAGPLQLIVRGSTGLADTAGNPLDGDRDGQPGGDYITRLR